MLQQPLRACVLCAGLVFGSSPIAALPIAAQEAAIPDPVPIESVEFRQLEGHQLELSFTYPGGACDRTGEATVAAPVEGVAEVTVPTRREGEVCTMQIVPVPFSGTLSLDAGTTGLEITVLAPDGKPAATGTVALDD